MSAAPPALRLLLRSLSEAAAMRYSYPDSSLFESALSMAKTIAAEVIPTPLHVLDRISPISPRFFPFFARFHRLDKTVPTSRKPEPRAKKQPTRPRGPPSIQALSAYVTNHLARSASSSLSTSR